MSIKQLKKNSFSGALLTLGLLFSTVAHAALPLVTNSLAPMLEKVTPAVVNISAQGTVEMTGHHPLYDDPAYRHFFNLPPEIEERPAQSMGSGVIIDADNGYVVTNSHVIDFADEINVTLYDGRRLEATLIGKDAESDIAVLQIESKNLTAVPLGDSDNIRVGDFAVAIGSPFGLSQTVTSGIISALARDGLGIVGYENFIQTDAPINPGNSGGALVNLEGELIGINTAIVAPSGGNVGIGFSIPSNTMASVMSQLIEFGEVQRGQLGVLVQDITQELAQAFDLDETAGGALVAQVMPGSAAENANIQPGDIIIAMNKKPIRNASDLRMRVGLVRVDSEPVLTVLRDGKEQKIKVTIAAPKAPSPDMKVTGQALLEGVSLSDYNIFRNNDVNGVLVLDVQRGTPAWRGGLRKDDIIISANRQAVTNRESLEQAISLNDDRLLLNVLRGPGALFLVIE